MVVGKENFWPLELYEYPQLDFTQTLFFQFFHRNYNLRDSRLFLNFKSIHRLIIIFLRQVPSEIQFGLNPNDHLALMHIFGGRLRDRCGTALMVCYIMQLYVLQIGLESSWHVYVVISCNLSSVYCMLHSCLFTIKGNG